MKVVFQVALLLWVQTVSAALPPRYQNAKDLDVLVSFVRHNEDILVTLQAIDFQNKVIYYRNGCKAIFGRRDTLNLNGGVGPAEPLEFKKSICPN